MRFGGKVFTTILMILSVIVFARPVFAQDENWNWQDGIPKYEEAKVAIVEDGPTLLFSDSPEMVKASGIMYQDKVQGDIRLFFHHVNDTDSLKKIAVVFRNVDKYLGNDEEKEQNLIWMNKKDIQEIFENVLIKD